MASASDSKTVQLTTSPQTVQLVLNRPKGNHWTRYGFSTQISSGSGTVVLKSTDGSTTFNTSSSYTDFSLINAVQAPGMSCGVRAYLSGSGSSSATVRITITATYEANTTATQYSKIEASIMQQVFEGSSISAGDKLNASQISGATAGNKVTASTINSILNNG